jgi:hypothetical protein
MNPVGLAGAGCLGDVAAIAGQLEASTVTLYDTASTRKDLGKHGKNMGKYGKQLRVSSTKDEDFHVIQ